MNTKMTWEEACQILGVLPTASAAEIHNQYIYKAQLLHPDKTINSPQSVREKAEEELKKVNAAYDFLKDPQNRPNNSPPKLHINLSHVRFNVDVGQKKSTTFQIDNIGGPYTNFWMDDSPSSWLKVTEVKSLTDAPLPIEVTIEATGTNISKKHSECFLPIKIENEQTKNKDEARLKIELKIKPSTGQSLTPISIISRIPKIQKWITALILTVALSIFGLGISLFVGNYLPLWILLGFSSIFSIEKWFSNIIKKHKAINRLYRFLLNLSILLVLALLIWSGFKLFTHQFFQSSIIGSFIFIAEFIFFIWIWKVVAKHSAQWPSMKLTIFSLVVLFLVFAFAGVSPFMELKDNFFSLFK
jgi:hypothetical protein